MNYIKEAYYLGPLVVTSFLLVFTRPFVGLSILGYRLGELFIVFAFLISILSSFYFFFKRGSTNYLHIKNIQIIFSLILLTLYLSIFSNSTGLLSSYTYKISSYVWTIGYLFLILYFFQNNSVINKYRKIILLVFLLIPIVHYYFSTGFYPNFVIDFFILHSDKFEFTKASDIMLSYVVANILNLKLNKNYTFNLYYLYLTGALLLPLLLFMSRGSFIAAFLFIVMFSFYNFSFFKSNIKKTIKIFIVTFIVFMFSTYNVNETEINYSFNFVGSENLANDTLSLSDNIKEIAKKDQQRKAFLSLYFDNGRLYSHDPTTDWRLDIWQDVVEDMNNKSLIMKGYGYNEIIPVMLDPSAPGRLGRDGLNEHVHNYFVNIFARGGIFQFLLFLFFYLSILLLWKKKYENYTVLIYILPILLNSALDMSMEGVQYPLVFYLILGYLINDGLEVRLKKLNNT